MSKRAEERALEAYPRDEDRELNYRRANYRIAYERGYEQAEKDLALTWQDVKRIVELADAMMPFAFVKAGVLEHEFQSEEDYYKAVLKKYEDGK